MDKLIKYIVIVLFIAFLIYSIPIFVFGFLYSHGAGGRTERKMESYEFKATTKNLKNGIKLICDKSKYLIYKDSVDYDIVNTGNVNTIQIIKDEDKLTYFLRLNEESADKNVKVKFCLYYINGKGKDDFGWFLNKKKKQIKLFEDNIIDPLSKQFERIEVE